MNYEKTGQLIAALRKERGWTQRKLAEEMNLSDRTISKWERGHGCPDISLLRELTQLLNVDIDQLLSGELTINQQSNGNLKSIAFYSCETCGNSSFSIGKMDVSCCGRHLEALTAYSAGQKHQMKREDIESEVYLTFDHPMTKEHYISFIAAVSGDKVWLAKLYPEQEAAVRIPKFYGAAIYSYCTKEGLFRHDEL
ncbi:XRE family transcriptional regulator [Enterococcus florum]|uniref:XRE family transcriptional regulator n=1 Tax=Enterococcus florum TaxID=2480627 RepID=A0A4P5P9H1_9ENTE|nr:helix-turn-helix domain-containing protein [Enterococcus florum]GCF94216.1 XRE family transcriptional regulator [Enterococcus florum]